MPDTPKRRRLEDDTRREIDELAREHARLQFDPPGLPPAERRMWLAEARQTLRRKLRRVALGEVFVVERQCTQCGRELVVGNHVRFHTDGSGPRTWHHVDCTRRDG